jgi:hypothetical protein
MAKKGAKFKAGDQVKVVRNSGGHNITLGTTATILSFQGSGYGYRLTEFPHWNVNVGDLEKLVTSFSRTSVETEKAELAAKIAALDTKLAFLDEIESDSGDEKEFKVFSTLTLVENGNLTKRQKAQAIAALLSDD